MKGVVLALTGDNRLLKTLNKTRDSVARKAMRKGIGKAVRVIAKGIKSHVPVDMKQIKPLIGTKVGKAKVGSEKGLFTAKAGTGVGRTFKKVAKRGEVAGAKQKGVGISGRNIHWWIMGTGERRSRLRNTGKMPAQAPDIVQQGFSSAAGEAKAVIAREVRAGLAAVKAR
jgi:hypothetical protein